MSTKDDVLEFFESNRGIEISGQDLADKLSCSRNTVWKAVTSLRDEGYKIESGTNRGYKFSEDNDRLSVTGIKCSFPGNLQDLEVRVFDQIDSTNNECKRMAASGFKGSCLVVSDYQTAGRGRRSRSFYSPQGKGVYFSLMLQNNSETADAVMMTMAAAVATARAISEFSDCEPKIKWVNDIFVDNRKVCGILTEGISDLETSTIQEVIIGIGINIGNEDFPQDIAGTAGAITLRKGVSRNMLVAKVVEHIEGMSTLNGDASDKIPDFVDEYRKLSLVIGREVDYELAGAKHHAKAVEINDDGSLVVEDSDGSMQTLHGGEVSVKL